MVESLKLLARPGACKKLPFAAGGRTLSSRDLNAIRFPMPPRPSNRFGLDASCAGVPPCTFTQHAQLSSKFFTSSPIYGIATGHGSHWASGLQIPEAALSGCGDTAYSKG